MKDSFDRSDGTAAFVSTNAVLPASGRIIFTFIVCLFTCLFTACQNPAGGTKTTGSITGKALFKNANDNSGIIVSLEQIEGARSLTVIAAARGLDTARALSGQTATNKDGMYTFDKVVPGSYTIYASSKDSSEQAVAINVKVEAGRTVTAPDLNLTPVGKISGTITLDGEKPGDSAFLVCIAGTSYMAATDADGNFIINNVPAGDNYLIIITKGNYTGVWSSTAVTVTGGETTILTPPVRDIESTELNSNVLHIGENGNWWIGETDTGVPATGPKGDDGHTPDITIGENGNWYINGVDSNIPATGPKGDDGHTPVITIGGNGNWYIDDEDTGVPATGPKGDDGHTPVITVGGNGNWHIDDVDTGVQAQGPQGEMPVITIGDNGNWYIDGVDTGVQAQGPQGPPGSLSNKLLILQVYGAGPTPNDGSVSHTFVELYNNTGTPIVLSAYSLQYADGTRSGKTTVDDWTVINLSGIIPANGSFLVRGTKMHDQNGSIGRLQIDTCDQDVPTFNLSNRSYKVALMSNQFKLTASNPFDIDGNGTMAAGYVDMIGALNSPPADGIDGYEIATADVISKQKAARRITLVEADNNAQDFTGIDYRLPSNGVNDADMERYRPRTASEGAWNPFEEPPSSGNTLLIFQVYGTGTTTDGAVSHTFVELYNNSENSVDISAYSLQYADGISSGQPTVGAWQKINLTGNIPAYGSYLILGENTNTSARLQITETSDCTTTGFILSNRSYKVALMSNQTLLTVSNPFDLDGAGTKSAGYVDMVGAINGGVDSIDAYEGAIADVISKQKSIRRRSLNDTDNNQVDFKDIDYRLPSQGVNDADLSKYRPRNASAGSYTPQF
jgi:hypothetical protein